MRSFSGSKRGCAFLEERNVWPTGVRCAHATYWLGTHQEIDQEKVQRTLDNLIMPRVDPSGPGGLPGFDLPPPPKVP